MHKVSFCGFRKQMIACEALCLHALWCFDLYLMVFFENFRAGQWRRVLSVGGQQVKIEEGHLPLIVCVRGEGFYLFI